MRLVSIANNQFFGPPPFGLTSIGLPPFGQPQIGLPPIGLRGQLDYPHLDYLFDVEFPQQRVPGCLNHFRVSRICGCTHDHVWLVLAKLRWIDHPSIRAFLRFSWRHLVAIFATNASSAIWWANFQLMQVAPSGGHICN